MNQLFDSLATDPTVATIGLAIVGAAAGLWLAAAWWTYTDMARRSTFEVARLAAVGWILVSTPALLPLSLGAYLLARPQQTVAERRAQRLFEALAPAPGDGGCPSCGERIDAEWRRCPACASWLASACGSCERWSAIDLDTCPWCAADKDAITPARSTERAAAQPAPAPGRAAVAVGPGLSAAPEPAPVPLFDADIDDATDAWMPAPASGEARPAAAFTAHRIGARSRLGNRGARDGRHARDAGSVAGSDRIGIG